MSEPVYVCTNEQSMFVATFYASKLDTLCSNRNAMHYHRSQELSSCK